MNIDEAIERLKGIIIISVSNTAHFKNFKLMYQDVDAIETIINEYQDLKDLSNELQIRYTIENMKYKDLKEIEEAHRKENGELKEKINELENEIEGLKQTFVIHDDIDNHIPHID